MVETASKCRNRGDFDLPSWQRGGGFDRNLFSHILIRQAIAYIEDNPVRKGLASDPSDWKWSSARARLRYDDVPLKVDEVNWELVDAE